LNDKVDIEQHASDMTHIRTLYL